MIRNTAICFILTALALGACGAPDRSTPDGLSLASTTEALTAGEFRQAGRSLAFELSGTEAETHFTLTTSNGAPLLDVERSGSVMKTAFFGNEVTVTAPAALIGAARTLPEDERRELLREVTITGDADALERIGKTPEFELLDDLTDALAAAGVDAVLPQAETFGQLELAVKDDTQQGESGGGGCDPDAPTCGEDDCNTFKQVACAAVLATCGAGCVSTGTGYVACVLPCLTAAGALFCSDCI